MMKKSIICLMIAAGALSSGCASKDIARPPVTISQYVLMNDTHSQYAAHTIVQYNIQRACNESLPTEARLDSLCLARELYTGDPGVKNQLGSLVYNPRTPNEIRSYAKSFMTQIDPGVKSVSPTVARSPVPAAAATPQVVSASPVRGSASKYPVR